MWQQISIFFLFCLMISHQKADGINNIMTKPIDIIAQTCKKCANQSEFFSDSFCEASLQTVDVSHSTNLQGLALIAMDLALKNATNTISSIEELLSKKTLDPFAIGCLNDCLDLYSWGVSTLKDAIRAFLIEEFDTANVWISAVMEDAGTCEDGFGEKEGEVSPLTNENYDLAQLCDIALCITHLLPSLPSNSS
ncbi:hypothetical protein UlMin_001414 [Ulmus minor]